MWWKELENDKSFGFELILISFKIRQLKKCCKEGIFTDRFGPFIDSEQAVL